MSKSSEKLVALKLRREGESIKDIAKKLQVSPSSVSLWCQSIVLTDKQLINLRNKQITAGQFGRQKGADANRNKRLQALSDAEVNAKNDIGKISNKDLFFIGLGIYWGEGVKSRTGQAAVVNSDSRIIKISKLWFTNCLSVPDTDFRPYLYISYSHKDRENELMTYWSNVLNLPISQFKSPIYIHQKTKQLYENHDAYYGVLALRVLKSTNLKYKILAMLNVLNERLE